MPVTMVFYNAVPTPCGPFVEFGYHAGRRDDMYGSKTPMHRLPLLKQRRKRFDEWSQRVNSSYYSEDKVALSWEELRVEMEAAAERWFCSGVLPEEGKSDGQHEDGALLGSLGSSMTGTGTSLPRVDPYDAWWNGKVSLYAFMKKALCERLVELQHQPSLEAELTPRADTNDKEAEAIVTCGDDVDDNASSLHEQLSMENDNSYSFSPRIVATTVYNWIHDVKWSRGGCPNSNEEHLSTAPIKTTPWFASTLPSPQLSFKVHFESESMYFGFMVIFILHYLYLLLIVCKQRQVSPRRRDAMGHRRRVEKLHVVTEEDDEEEGDEQETEKMDGPHAYPALHEDQFSPYCKWLDGTDDELLGRELHIHTALAASAPTKGACGSHHRPPSVATLSTFSALSLLEGDSDDNSTSSSSSSASFEVIRSEEEMEMVETVVEDWYQQNEPYEYNEESY